MRIPALRHHRARQQGYARYRGKWTYFGHWPRNQKNPPADVWKKYEDWRHEFVQNMPSEPRKAPPRNVSIDELWARYHARNLAYYRKHGKVTSEPNAIAQACRIVARMFGTTPAARFTARQLLQVRDEFIKMGWSRTNINDQVSRVRSMFHWAGKAEQSLIPVSVYYALKEIEPLKVGRCTVRESPRVRAVPWEDVEASLPLMGEVVRTMIRVHYLLGCRSQDIVRMRPKDLDHSGQVWEYRPEEFKTEHHVEQLVYPVGPQAQGLLRPLLEACKSPEAWVFPCRQNGGLGRYTTNSYRYHVTRRLKKAGLPRWVPLQLRHTRLTEIRKLYGAEMAQVWAQHRHLKTTQIYAEADWLKVRDAAGEIG